VLLVKKKKKETGRNNSYLSRKERSGLKLAEIIATLACPKDQNWGPEPIYKVQWERFL
jgi:hypothetical protein